MTVHNLGGKTTAFQLQSCAVISATAAGQVGGAAAFLDAQQYEGDIVLTLDHAAAGSGVTLTAKIQESDASGSGYTDVTGGAFTAAAANTAGFATLTLQGDTLTVDATLAITDQRARKAAITATDVLNSNGVIHIIDKVILPRP